MKRIILLLLAVLLLIPAACGGKDAGSTLRQAKMTQDELDQLPEDRVTLHTSLGFILGIRQEGWLEFRGIRYASAARWELPIPVTGWEGVYDATRWGPRSLQYLGFYGQADNRSNQFYADEALVSRSSDFSEDSLNLNLWVPEQGESLPVLVYFHGGAFVTGSGIDTPIDGEVYARRGVILVSVNYRLGPFSNAGTDGYPCNLALHDQLTALRWIRDNISDYGGDPSRITVMGESAGAISVQNLLISPLVEDGLIAGAIMLSGGGDMSAIHSPTYPQTCSMAWSRVKTALGVRHLSELAALSDRELFDAWYENTGELRSLSANPVLDGEALTLKVTAALERGQVKDVPAIIGILSQDMLPHTLYQAATAYAESRAEAGGAPVYLYYFDREQPGSPSFGAFHAADLYYVFGTLCRNRRPFEEVDFRISQNMIDYITHFVQTGDPNGGLLPRWETVGTGEARFLCFGKKKPTMMEPDPAELKHTQAICPPFPLASAIKPPQ